MNSSITKTERILIVGGGFAGVKCALELSKRAPNNAKIRLMSDQDHFEYQGGLYRVVAGHTPLETCVPFYEIFDGTRVEYLKDPAVSVDAQAKRVVGASGSHYDYDTLVLAIGSESTFFNIPGLEKLAYTMKSVNDAIKLNKHIQQVFHEALSEQATADRLDNMHIVIVGGGPSGTELAGELAVYCRKMCVDVCKIDQSLVTIDLIEAAPRLLGMMPPAFSKAIEMRLRSLGVNILLNRAVMKEELETVYLKDMEMRTKTMVWTAGVKPHRLLGQIQGFTWDKRGRVEVNEYLQAKGFNNVYVLGDGAATQYSGRAQTALRDGEYAGRTIARKLKGLKLVPYVPKDVITAIPIGPGWAGVQWGKMAFYGSIGWFLRRAADFRVYWSILPLRKAITAYRDGAQLCDNYPDCFDMPYAKPQEVAPLAAPALK